MHLTAMSGLYAVAKSRPDAAVPDGVLNASGFVSLTRTDDELSLVAPEGIAASMETAEGRWTVFKLRGPFAFDEVGIVAGLSGALAKAGIGIFVVSTYETDYILVKAENAAAAADLWRGQGHEVVFDD